MSELTPELEALALAIQAHASAQADEGNPLVTQAVVVYETVALDDDGTPMRRISYTVPTENFSVSGAVGLIEAGGHYLRRDALGDER